MEQGIIIASILGCDQSLSSVYTRLISLCSMPPQTLKAVHEVTVVARAAAVQENVPATLSTSESSQT